MESNRVFKSGFWFKIRQPYPEISLLSRYNLLKVGNRVVKSPRSDSSNSCFWIFCSIVYTPTKKKPYHEIPCYLPIFRYLLSKSKLRRKSCNFLAAEGSTLNSNILGSVRILFNIYILVWKVFWSAFQWYILKYCQFFSFLVRGQNVKKKLWKNHKNLHFAQFFKKGSSSPNKNKAVTLLLKKLSDFWTGKRKLHLVASWKYAKRNISRSLFPVKKDLDPPKANFLRYSIFSFYLRVQFLHFFYGKRY